MTTSEFLKILDELVSKWDSVPNKVPEEYERHSTYKHCRQLANEVSHESEAVTYLLKTLGWNLQWSPRRKAWLKEDISSGLWYKIDVITEWEKRVKDR